MYIPFTFKCYSLFFKKGVFTNSSSFEVHGWECIVWAAYSVAATHILDILNWRRNSYYRVHQKFHFSFATSSTLRPVNKIGPRGTFIASIGNEKHLENQFIYSALPSIDLNCSDKQVQRSIFKNLKKDIWKSNSPHLLRNIAEKSIWK